MLDELTATVVEKAGVRLHTRSGGHGPAALLLHGHPQCILMCHRVLPALMARINVALMEPRVC